MVVLMLIDKCCIRIKLHQLESTNQFVIKVYFLCDCLSMLSASPWIIQVNAASEGISRSCPSGQSRVIYSIGCNDTVEVMAWET